MLSALIWVPVLGAALIGFWPSSMPASRIRLLALVVASGLIFWTVVLLGQFDISNAGMQFTVPWLKPLA